MKIYRLSKLKLLEAESIHFLREVAASLEKPVMLYSAGKDSFHGSSCDLTAC